MHYYLTRVTPHIRVSPSISKSENASAVLRAVIHSFLLMPINQSIYWYLNGFFKNNLSHEKGCETFRAKIIDGKGLSLAFLYWVPISVAMYTVVPMRYGNLCLDSFGFLWAIFISYYGTV